MSAFAPVFDALSRASKYAGRGVAIAGNRRDRAHQHDQVMSSQVAPAETLGPVQKSRYLAKLKSRNTSLGFLEEAAGRSFAKSYNPTENAP
jgi:hypothetical protein